MIGRDHRLGGLLEVVEPLRLVRDAVCHFLDIASDVGEFHAKAANTIGELIDQPLGKRPVGAGVQYCKLYDGHVR